MDTKTKMHHPSDEYYIDIKAHTQFLDGSVPGEFNYYEFMKTCENKNTEKFQKMRFRGCAYLTRQSKYAFNILNALDASE